MSTAPAHKRSMVDFFQRHIANPITRRLPTQVLLETTGRVSGQRRTTPIGGRRDGTQFWLVAEHGETANYIRNIKANNAVRVRIGGRWHSGTAHLMPDDDAQARLETLPRVNSALVRTFGTDLLTVRIDLD
ncbi:nitroreductase [Mycolicibacter minnesotensis]|uniref:Nitroreductase n=1 Tax=Mycolicibacter minnesotensis TaxID=1118379 RepID=A0A7I7R7Q2_9MYCO|nr:nitroreductase/quinone reductase family protein [Mycolicibacter minnesotensis]ORA99176.1 nitroreductase [Mycolicibacter minnesotensis]BBY34665.1 hypothetical protein MMIN_27260 [Mycolicibacter minnesotensis]